MKRLSRRHFLRRCATTLAIAGRGRFWIPSAHSQAPSPLPEDLLSDLPVVGRLTREEWSSLKRIADAIIPAGPRKPSASQVGVLHYIDRALKEFETGSTPVYRRALKSFAQMERKAQHLLAFSPVQAQRSPEQSSEPTGPAGTQNSLTEAQVTAFVELFEKENPHDFETIRGHVMEGYFSAPRHGRNDKCQGQGQGWTAVKLRSHVLPYPEVHPR